MFIIIVGCSEAGYSLAKLLLASGHEVVVMEQKLQRCRLLWEEMGSVVFQGDGADQEDLRQAGAARAQCLIAVTGKDETNLVICQLGKQLFSIAQTVAVIRDDKNQAIFRILGVDKVINAGDLILGALEGSIMGDKLNHLRSLPAPNTVLVSVTIPEDAQVIGKPLAQIELPPHSFFSLVIRQNRALAPGEAASLAGNDEAYLVTRLEEETSLYDTLTGA